MEARKGLLANWTQRLNKPLRGLVRGTSVARPIRRVFAMRFTALVCTLSVLVGCGPKGAATPDEAHARLAAAVAAHDSVRLWNALDQDTHWSWMTILRAWREAYDITQSVVPEGAERARLIARFEPGATSEDAEALFIRMLEPDDWRQAASLLAAAGTQRPELAPSGETSEIATSAGPLVYRKPRNRFWGWGYAGLDAKAEQIKRTASDDLERMRSDAADYERAATRGAR